MARGRPLELAVVFVLPLVGLAMDVLLGRFVTMIAPVGMGVAMLIGMGSCAASNLRTGGQLHGFLFELMALGFSLALAIRRRYT